VTINSVENGWEFLAKFALVSSNFVKTGFEIYSLNISILKTNNMCVTVYFLESFKNK